VIRNVCLGDARRTSPHVAARPALRELVLESGTRQSGGGRATVTTRQGLVPAARGIAQLILAQYEVTYSPGARKVTSRLQVGVNRPVGRVLAPRWLGK
jgi:hypothetical protein